MTAQRFNVGDRIRIDIPDETDPDHHLHGHQGKVIDVRKDDAGIETGDKRDSKIYRVELDNGDRMDARWRDLRPAFDE